VAVAKKKARIVWALLSRGGVYEAPVCSSYAQTFGGNRGEMSSKQEGVSRFLPGTRRDSHRAEGNAQ
jgi:hypothetical protein